MNPEANRDSSTTGEGEQEAASGDLRPAVIEAAAPPDPGAQARKTPERDDASVIAGETEIPVGTAAGESPGEQSTAQRETASSTGKHAFLVGAGILISRLIGLVRQRVFAHYFGTS